MKLHVDRAGNQRIRPLREAHVHRREAIERDSQHVEDRVDVLLHAAAFGADRDAFPFEIGNGLNRRAREFHEAHGPGIGRRNHAYRDRLGEWRGGILGAPDPVRSHEAELQLAAIELLGVVNAGVGSLHDALVAFSAPAIEQLGDRLALSVKRAAMFRSADSYRHLWSSNESKRDQFPLHYAAIKLQIMRCCAPPMLLSSVDLPGILRYKASQWRVHELTKKATTETTPSPSVKARQA